VTSERLSQVRPTRIAVLGLSHEALMTNIELYGTEVIPRVREVLAEAKAG